MRFAKPERVPTHLHEAVAQVVSDAPRVLDELLTRAFGEPLPPYVSVDRLDSNLSEAPPAEYRSDGTYVFHGADGKNVAAFVVEIQLRRDDDKDWKWPTYLAQARDRVRCSTDVCVIALDEATAVWASRPVALGRSNVFRPIVLGPRQIPLITSSEEARQHPEMAILSAFVHRKEMDGEAATAVAEGVAASGMENGLAAYYIDVVRQVLPEFVRKAVEDGMIPSDYVPSEFAVAFVERMKAKQAAIEEGMVRGELVTLRRAIEGLMADREWALTVDDRAKLEGCSDPNQLHRWLRRVPMARTTRDIFTD